MLLLSFFSAIMLFSSYKSTLMSWIDFSGLSFRILWMSLASFTEYSTWFMLMWLRKSFDDILLFIIFWISPNTSEFVLSSAQVVLLLVFAFATFSLSFFNSFSFDLCICTLLPLWMSMYPGAENFWLWTFWYSCCFSRTFLRLFISEWMCSLFLLIYFWKF